MRALETKDLFSMARIVSKTNIKEDLRKIVDEKKDQTAAGIDLILAILGGISSKDVEKEIYSFLADVLEASVDDIIHSDPFVLIDRLTKDEGAAQWTDFFTKLYKLITRQF